jgi:hypothetical protein
MRIVKRYYCPRCGALIAESVGPVMITTKGLVFECADRKACDDRRAARSKNVR